MNKRILPITGSLAVLILPPAIAFLTGIDSLYVIVLIPLLFVLWRLSGLHWTSIGLITGTKHGYILSLLYPVWVILAAVLILLGTGNLQTSAISLDTVVQIVTAFLFTFIGVIFTEEGFFRGWLWGILEKNEYRSSIVLIWTSYLYCLWHLAAVLVLPDLRMPFTSIPVYVFNILLIGFNFGLIRQISGSIFPSSIAHSLWNALLYPLFGYGTTTGALNLSSYKIFDPERGYIGTGLNLIIFMVLWKLSQKRASE
ncbi:CPBP family intramembrane glutamic endopeptidase [candidate division KSB1 bacterium]